MKNSSETTSKIQKRKRGRPKTLKFKSVKKIVIFPVSLVESVKDLYPKTSFSVVARRALMKYLVSKME